MSEPFRLRYVNQIVGAVLLLALLILLALAMFVIRGRYIFAKNIDYNVTIPQAMVTGLRKGSDVSILGEVVGRVHQIGYAPDGQNVQLALKIKEPFRDQILHDSQIQMRRKFGVGEPYLELVRGNDLLGAVTSDVPSDVSQSLGLGAGEGVSVQQVIPEGPLDTAGVMDGDVIISVNEQPVAGASQMATMVGKLKSGDPTEVELLRQDEGRIRTTAIARRSGSVPLSASAALTFNDANDARIGGMADQVSSTMGDVSKLATEGTSGLKSTFWPSFTEFNGASQSVRETSETIRPAATETLQNANEFMAQMQDEIHQLFATINEVVDEDARPALKDLASTLENVNSLIDEIGPAAVGTLDEIEGAGKSLNEVLVEVNDIVVLLKTELQSLPGTVPEIRRTVRDVNEVVSAVRNSRLITGMVKRSGRGCGARKNNCKSDCCPSPPRRSILQRRWRR